MLFNVPLDHRKWCAATGGGKVARTPKHVLVVPVRNGWHALSEHPGGNTLEAVDQFGELDLRRVIDQNVNVVVFTFERSEFNIEVVADFLHHFFENVQSFAGKDPFAVFGHKDQVRVNGKNTVPACSNFVFCCHRPNCKVK